MKIFSWNVDKLDPQKVEVVRNYIETTKPDLICFNETKDKEDIVLQLLKDIDLHNQYEYIINVHNPARYHGVAVMILKSSFPEAKPIDFKLLCPSRQGTFNDNPCCGRIIAVEIKPKLIVIAVYAPNSGADPKVPLKNLAYRVEKWDVALFSELLELEKDGNDVILIGDINVAPREIDVDHPSRRRGLAGFTFEECNNFNAFLEISKWIDIWRYQHPDLRDYSYKGYSQHSAKMRLDSAIISPGLVEKYKIESSILSGPAYILSDHNPITLELH